MHLMFKKGNVFDKSPFQYGTMGLLLSRVEEYQNRMESVSETQIGLIEGNKNILIRLLQSINTEFNGNLLEFMSKVNSEGMDLSRIVGMTSNYAIGKLFHGTFYDGCDEIFIAGRNEEFVWTDLWYKWRIVSPVVVLDHPITELTYFMPGVRNKASITGGNNDRLCIFLVDIPLLYTQWHLYRASKINFSMESYLTEIVYPNMMKSHMDIVMLNRVLMKMGIIEQCEVKSNLPFHQTPMGYEMDRIVDIVIKNYSGRRMEVERYISSIPGVFKEDVSKSITDPQLMPTIQCMWTTLSMKAKRAALGLEIHNKGGITGAGYYLSRLRRTVIQNESQKRFDVVNGGEKLQARFDKYVTDRLPK